MLPGFWGRDKQKLVGWRAEVNGDPSRLTRFDSHSTYQSSHPSCGPQLLEPHLWGHEVVKIVEDSYKDSSSVVGSSHLKVRWTLGACSSWFLVLQTMELEPDGLDLNPERCIYQLCDLLRITSNFWACFFICKTEVMLAFKVVMTNGHLVS
jgi:hypothetical protein